MVYENTILAEEEITGTPGTETPETPVEETPAEEMPTPEAMLDGEGDEEKTEEGAEA